MACVESQRVRGTEGGGDHGIDGPKKINGVKRPILVDTLGLLLAVFVTAASGTVVVILQGSSKLVMPDVRHPS